MSTNTDNSHARYPKPFPQVVAHRGYNTRYPENTMCSFIAAVEAGAHALEADVHISKDGIIVLSHVSERRA